MSAERVGSFFWAVVGIISVYGAINTGLGTLRAPGPGLLTFLAGCFVLIVAVVEILKSNSRTRDCVEQGERPGRTLLDAIKASESEGMQHFDGEIAKLVRSGLVDLETGLSFASNATVLGQELARS